MKFSKKFPKLHKSSAKELSYILRLRNFSIAFFFILFFISSCKKKDDIVVGGQPITGQSNFTQYPLSGMQAKTVFDTLQKTSKTDNILLGNYYDPVTGIAKTSAYFQMSYTTFPTIADTSKIIIDSAKLYLEVNLIYGKNVTPQSFILKPLSEQLYSDSTYYINDSLSVSQETISNEVSYTDLSAENYLSLSIDTTFARKILFASQEYADESSFLDYLKGFYITSETAPAYDDGAIYHISPYESNTKLVIYYTDTSTFEQNTAELTISANANYFSSVKHDYTKGSIYPKIDSYEYGKTELCIQSMSGLAVKMKLPFDSTLENQAINQALLIITPETEDLTHYNINPRLFLYGIDDNGSRFVLPDYDKEGSDFFGGVYDDVSNTYTINITRYLQDFFLKNNPNDSELDFYLTSFDIASGAILNSRRTVVKGPENLQGNLKIVVSFTSFNE